MVHCPEENAIFAFISNMQKYISVVIYVVMMKCR